MRYFEPTSITCLLEPWLRELGFSIFYGSILIKLYRILTEFQTRKAHRVCFRDKDQIVYLLAIVLIVVGYMSAWTALMVDGFFFGRSQKMLNLPQTHFATMADRYQHHLEPARLPFGTTSTSTSTRYARSLSTAAAFKRDSQVEMEHLLVAPDGEPPGALRSQHRLTSSANNSFSASGSALIKPGPAHLLLNYSDLAATAAARASSAATGTTGISINRPRNSFEPAALRQLLDEDSPALMEPHEERLDEEERSGLAHSWSSAIDQWTEYPSRQFEIIVKNLNSFSDLFSGLLETERLYDEASQTLTYSMRCRKLTWDYVTELSKFISPLFGCVATTTKINKNR